MQQFKRQRAQTMAASPFEVAYVPSASVGDLGDEEHLLAAIYYTPDGISSAAMPDHITVPLQPLGNSLIEVWRSRTSLERDHAEDIFFSRNEDVLFGHLCMAERDYGSLDAAIFEAYKRIYAFVRRQAFPHLLRIWNFLPDINGERDGMERYQAFCQGRHRALERFTAQSVQLPAASAIGTQGDSLQIYFIAAHEPGSQVENPRQVSAFHYPPRYGPKSPAFSRAVIKRWDTSIHLYISGTASIVGHESRHPFDTLAQLDETLNNLEALVSHAGRLHSLDIHSVRELSLLKIYVREPGECDAIIARLVERLGTEIPMLPLRGDICRSNLRLEIEGLCTGKGAAD
jgi:chorismate lyase / 3-hydroxybenzoate synthase